VGDDDRDLVDRCLRGDERACETLVANHARMVGTVIWRATGRREEVEDLSQETFLRVFRALAYFDARARLSTWIYTIAHRVAIDHLRKISSSRQEPLTWTNDGDDAGEQPVIASAEPDPEVLLSRERSQELLRDAIARLPEKFRLPVVYAAIDGLDYASIAEMLGVPIGTVKTHVFRGKQLLKADILRRQAHTHAR
jgi:RNA polymerase sigma-70 factor (ECF subfamily)